MTDKLTRSIYDSKSKPETFREIAFERMAQEEKWGQQDHDPLYWLGILGEEFGEVCRAVIESYNMEEEKLTQVKAELIQVAAVAVAFIESLERNS